MTRRFNSLLGPAIALLLVPALAMLAPASAESVVGQVGRADLKRPAPKRSERNRDLLRHPDRPRQSGDRVGPLARRPRDPRGNTLVRSGTCAGTDRPAGTGFHRQPREQGRGSRHQGGGTCNVDPLLGLFGTSFAVGSAGEHEQQGPGVGSGQPSDLRVVRGFPRCTIWTQAGRDRSMERARSGQRRLFGRTGKGQALRGNP